MLEHEHASTTRRNFLGKTCPALAGMALGLSLVSCDSGSSMDEVADDPPIGSGDNGITIDGNVVRLDLSKNVARVLAATDGFLLVTSAQVVAVNVGNDTIRAFTSICTHQGCEVNRFSSGAMVCPCHGSRFNTRGQVTQGPATRALTEYNVARAGDIVTITKS